MVEVKHSLQTVLMKELANARGKDNYGEAVLIAFKQYLDCVIHRHVSSFEVLQGSQIASSCVGRDIVLSKQLRLDKETLDRRQLIHLYFSPPNRRF